MLPSFVESDDAQLLYRVSSRLVVKDNLSAYVFSLMDGRQFLIASWSESEFIQNVSQSNSLLELPANSFVNSDEIIRCCSAVFFWLWQGDLEVSAFYVTIAAVVVFVLFICQQFFVLIIDDNNYTKPPATLLSSHWPDCCVQLLCTTSIDIAAVCVVGMSGCHLHWKFSVFHTMNIGNFNW